MGYVEDAAPRFDKANDEANEEAMVAVVVLVVAIVVVVAVGLVWVTGVGVVNLRIGMDIKFVVAVGAIEFRAAICVEKVWQ